MTAGVIGRLPRVGVIVVCDRPRHGHARIRGDLDVVDSCRGPGRDAHRGQPEPLVVPDVRKQAYVFAKGSLEQDGFAWRVEGSVPGFAANVVVSQSPAPGTRVIADGAPIVVLRLSQNGSYKQEGVPENVSPYAGKPARLVGSVQPKPKVKAKARTTAVAAAPKPAATKAKTTPKRKPAEAAAAASPPSSSRALRQSRLDEILLTARAKQLAAWVEKHPQRSRRGRDHWLYQHNWIVTGAGFGWVGGAEALRTLVAVDERVQRLWGVGAESERLARRTLAEVETRSR